MASPQALHLLEQLHESYMDPRPDWNFLGPPLPRWFREGIKRIDSLLTLQFIPPAVVESGRGCDPDRFPKGVWVVCRRMRSSRLLHKTWVCGLVDAIGLPKPPTPQLLKVIRFAYNGMRNRHQDHLAEEFSRQVASLHSEKCVQSRQRKLAKIADSMRRRNIRSHIKPRVFMTDAMPS